MSNVKAASIGYWFVSALDPWTSKVLGSWGVKQCFNAPRERMRYRGSGAPPVGNRPCPSLPCTVTNAQTVFSLRYKLQVGQPALARNHVEQGGCSQFPLDCNPHNRAVVFLWGSFESLSPSCLCKVYVIAAVHELGFHVIHSDTDVTWFNVGWMHSSFNVFGLGE